MCWPHIHWSITMNTVGQKKKKGKNGRESGQVVQIFKKYISDSYYGTKVLIRLSLPLTTCSRKQFIVSHPESLFIMKRYLSLTFSLLTLILSFKIQHSFLARFRIAMLMEESESGRNKVVQENIGKVLETHYHLQ